MFKDEDGKEITISDVELIYGNPLEPEELDDGFWTTFEASLDKIDTERLNFFFGKDRKGLRKMNKSILNASRILKEAFSSWIATITIDDKESGYQFGDNCLFINFNYTDTLIKRFEVKEENEYHIHGEAVDKKSIVIGHATHPQLPEDALYQFGGRFRGLYFVEKILYETDKHVQDNIQCLCMFLAMHAAMAEEIKNVYVLGHSMGLPDMEYFAFLVNATRIHNSEEYEHKEGNEDLLSMDELNNRLQYAVNRVGYNLGDENIEENQEEAVVRKFSQEQEVRNQEFQKTFIKSFARVKEQDIDDMVAKTLPRTEDASWHISYYSERDKQWIDAFMKQLACKKVKLYPTIDECLAPFKVI